MLCRCDRRRKWKAILLKFIQINLDAFADESRDFLACLSGNAQAREIGCIGPPASILASFVDDEIAAICSKLGRA